MPQSTPFVLIIRDGWGTNPNAAHDEFNAVKHADTPAADRLMADYPTTLIATSGEDVGLTDGTMGNSEVGHQNIGAGRIVYQDAVRISIACRESKLGDIAALTENIKAAVTEGRKVHLMGINSDAGVHGQLEHLYALLRLCKDLGAEQNSVCIHLFTDGRDTGPFTGKAFAAEVEAECDKIGVGRIASVVGRYWAMDRDNRWERVKTAYDLLTGQSPDAANFATASDAIQDYYDNPTTDGTKGDEFIAPRTVGDAASTRIEDGDCVIFYNYRGDRPREICSAFLLPKFDGADELKPSPETGARGFDRGTENDRPLDLKFVLMTPYSERLAELAPVAFPKPPKMKNILGEHLANLGIRQFRCAETEKFPHVTFFFNDYRDDPFAGESREIVQSPTDVKTYDERPEMSAEGVCQAVLGRLTADDCEPVIIVNFANGDMVGHTGSFDAAKRACEVVDACVGRIVDATLAKGGSLIVTADHGNAEQMWSPKDDAPHTAHTTYTVPLIVVGNQHKGTHLRDGGRLADIAPTALHMIGVDQPAEMTGQSLLPR
ncbi:MAG: 2,3-bisphosphoglycerate-independent phosphoglycerate mutase [Planctomycetota bacterium]